MRATLAKCMVLSVFMSNLTACAKELAEEPEVSAQQFQAGELANGQAVDMIKMTASNGVTATLLAYGATLQSYSIPNRNGELADVVLGHDTPAEYEANRDFFGVTVGRFANRIANGTFELDGQTYQLTMNEPNTSLHGGEIGWDRKLWKIDELNQSNDSASVTFSHISEDGDQGYPGKVVSTVTYALDKFGELTITMTAETDKPTIINMTNHALFNMAGHCAPEGAMDQILTIPASHYTPVNEDLIPTGDLMPVEGTVFDFRNGKAFNDGLRNANEPQILLAHGYDHNWALDKGLTEDAQFIARVEEPKSGRAMEVFSTEPGLQMYTGNFLDGTNFGKGHCLYRMGDGFVLEPQKFPDAPNQPQFTSARLNPDETYTHVMILKPALATQNSTK